MHYSSQSVGVFGITGYAGTELMKLLSIHPKFELTFAQSKSAIANTVGDMFPLLTSFGGVRISRENDAEGIDIAFLCLPAGESMGIVPGLLKKGVRVVDLGPDYRLKPARLFESVYGTRHTDPENLESSTYGVTELNRQKISEAPVVANPGCYPTAALIALSPILDIISGSIIIDAKSGTSGSGKEPSQFNNHSEIGENVKPYNPNRHRHLPEIATQLAAVNGHSYDITFVPHLVPIVRGIEESIYLPGTPYDGVLSRLKSFYSGSKFVHIVDDASINMVLGTNHCALQVSDLGNGTAIFSYIDNLGKGASGQALQNANVMVGFPEEAGLLASGCGVGR